MTHDYQCRRCKAKFARRDNDKEAVECPVCGSADVKKSGVSSDISEFLVRFLSSGG